MSTKVLSFTLLLLCLCFQASAFGDRRYAGKMLPCCKAYVPNISSSDVIGNRYVEQRSQNSCVEAIILATNSGTACVDPNAEWVKKLTANMKKL